jgi:hypothetical protein
MIRCALFLALLIPTAAIARSSEAAVVADVEWKHGAEDHIIINDTLWKCDGNRCSGTVLDYGKFPAWTCRKVHRAAGAVTRFTVGAREFSESELKTCNS